VRNPRGIDAIARVGEDLPLLDGHLHHAPQHPVVPMNRGRREPASTSSFSQFSISSAGRWPSRSHGSAAGCTSRCLAGRSPACSSPASGTAASTRLPPHRQWDIGVGRVHPLSAQPVRVELAEEPLCVRLARERARYLPRCFSM
jgi:hypothetical protein